MDGQAIQLNEIIRSGNAAIPNMLSRRGREIYFPKLGILSQSAQAKSAQINTTIGIALEEDGTPMRLQCVMSRLNLAPAQALNYAPSPGSAELRATWKKMLLQKNPLLAGKSFGLPVVTSALTHGLSICGYLFCDPEDEIILPDLFWENYTLIFSNAYGAKLRAFPAFTAAGAFNTAGLRESLINSKQGKKIVLLNFPNNPAGYTPQEEEMRAIAATLTEAAQTGPLVVIMDDAYFGLVYEPDVFKESLFSLICDAHPNLLAVKLDGPTKEDYVWGFRVGFLTFGSRGASPAVYEALEAKTSGAIRGSISNASNLGQSLLTAAYAEPAYAQEKHAKFNLLKARYETVKKILSEHPEYAAYFRALPFNSGYFMCIRPEQADPEMLRQKLLADYSTGVIAMNGMIRIAFSATPMSQLPVLFDNIYRAARDLADAFKTSAKGA